MELSPELLREFAEVTKDNTDEIKKEKTVYGTAKKQGEKMFVQFDGSKVLTPVMVAMSAEDGDRVIVTIKNHSATITGNITNPASSEQQDLSEFIKETDIEIISTADIDAIFASLT